MSSDVMPSRGRVVTPSQARSGGPCVGTRLAETSLHLTETQLRRAVTSSHVSETSWLPREPGEGCYGSKRPYRRGWGARGQKW